MELIFCCEMLKEVFFDREMGVETGEDTNEVWLDVSGEESGWTYCPYCGEEIRITTKKAKKK